jgi:superfamily II DNA or RNA helicase
MPAEPNWECDEDGTCKIRVEDVAHSELRRIYDEIYEIGASTSGSDKSRREELRRRMKKIQSGEHLRKLKMNLEEVSEDIRISEAGGGEVRKFYEIEVPGGEGMVGEAEEAIGEARYSKGASERKAFKPEIRLTCHSEGGEWDGERVERLTPDGPEHKSPYPHLPDMRPTLVVVHTVALAEQWKESISDETFLNIPEEEIGQIGGGEKDFCPVTVTTYQSLSKPRIQDALKGKVGTVVVDEVHHGSAESWNEGIRGLDVKDWKVEEVYDEENGRLREKVVPKEYLPPELRPYKLGLSATPTPFGPERKALLSEAIGDKLISVKDSEIVKAGFILPVKMRRKMVDPQDLTRHIHDSSEILRADAREHINEIRAFRWNNNLDSTWNIHQYKVEESEVRRERNAAFNLAGVMFDAAAMDENKMKTALERISASPGENFLVYSPRVLPLYFISKAAQSMGLDPAGCRPRLGEEVPEGACESESREGCEAIDLETEDGEPSCVWSEGALPFVGSASRDIGKYRDMYKEIRSSIERAKEEERAGALLTFLSQKFGELRDPSVPLGDKRETVAALSGERCVPNLEGGAPFSPEEFEECVSRGEECGDDAVELEGGGEVSRCKKHDILDPRLPVYPERVSRSIDIAASKLDSVKRDLRRAERMDPESAEEYIQGKLASERVGLKRDSEILEGLAGKVGGDAALEKRKAEMLTGSFTEEHLLRNLDHITIGHGMRLEDYLDVRRVDYDRLVDRRAGRRLPIKASGKPGAVLPFPHPLGGSVWGVRPTGFPSVHPKLRRLTGAARFVLASGMRDAVNRGAFDIANYFRGTEVTSEVLSDFDEGKTRILPTTYKEGIDIPGATNLIIASAYTKPKDVIQLTGRIKRIADGKEPGETLFLTSRGTVDERYFRSSMRNLIADVYHTEHGEEMISELESGAGAE